MRLFPFGSHRFCLAFARRWRPCSKTSDALGLVLQDGSAFQASSFPVQSHVLAWHGLPPPVSSSLSLSLIARSLSLSPSLSPPNAQGGEPFPDPPSVLHPRRHLGTGEPRGVALVRGVSWGSGGLLEGHGEEPLESRWSYWSFVEHSAAAAHVRWTLGRTANTRHDRSSQTVASVYANLLTVFRVT